MQALMLAAGMGRRMGKYTEKCTKCMISVAGKTLIERTTEALKKAGVRKMVMVVGYECDKLVNFINENIYGLEFEFVYNYDFAKTNNIYSLYLARHYLESDDTILIESDLIYDLDLIDSIIKDPQKNLVAVEKYASWMNGTVVTLDENKNIIEFIEKEGFRYDEADRYFKTVNIYKFSRTFSQRQYIPFLEAYIKAYGSNQYYELVLKTIAHIEHSELKAYILENVDWYEIDDAQDLDIANTIFAEDKDMLGAYEYRFGGYWRFPNIKDYCYLVNPYYPPTKMLDQMKYFYNTLLTQYPSGMNVQKLNAGRFFEVDEEFLLVGNGAAELISVLGRFVSGKMGLHMPTFNEYARCFPECDLQEIELMHDNFEYNLALIMEIIDEVDNLVLINPDNPSGSFIRESDMLEIIERCEKKGVLCIIDESFIDFADRDLRYTLIQNHTLNRYKNLVVLKSISKSYGVPGLRLGILAASDKNLISKVRDALPVWNINSFAEYFLQINSLYKREYWNACDKIARQRAYMEQKLVEINYITTFPSQANYIMCELKDGFTSKNLAGVLLKEKGILLKDLSEKKGFCGKNFIRIAVKSKDENDYLMNALQEIAGRV